MKQMMVSMIAILLAAGILAATVLYTLAVIRDAQIRILTGEIGVSICD